MKNYDVCVRIFKHRYSLGYLTLTVPPICYDLIDNLNEFAELGCYVITNQLDCPWVICSVHEYGTQYRTRKPHINLMFLGDSLNKQDLCQIKYRWMAIVSHHYNVDLSKEATNCHYQFAHQYGKMGQRGKDTSVRSGTKYSMLSHLIKKSAHGTLVYGDFHGWVRQYMESIYMSMPVHVKQVMHHIRDSRNRVDLNPYLHLLTYEQRDFLFCFYFQHVSSVSPPASHMNTFHFNTN